MATRQHRPSKLARMALPVISAMFVGYFAYHAVEGDLGLVGSQRLMTREQQLQDQLNRLVEERHELEGKVTKLRAPDIDEDVLDERARAVLNFTRPEDVVILKPKAADSAVN